MLDKITVTDGKLAENKKIVGRKPAKLSAIQNFKTKASNLKQSIKKENVSVQPAPAVQTPEETKPVEVKNESVAQPVVSNNTVSNNVVNFPDALECEKRLTNKNATCTIKLLTNKLTSTRKLRVADRVIDFTRNVKNNVQKVELASNQPKEEEKKVYDFSKSFETMTPPETNNNQQEESSQIKETETEKPYSWLRNEDTTISKGIKEEPKEDNNIDDFQALMEQKATTIDSLATQREILMNLRKQVEQNNALCEAKKRDLMEENMALTQELNDILAEINQLSDTVSQQEAFLGISDEEVNQKTV